MGGEFWYEIGQKPTLSSFSMLSSIIPPPSMASFSGRVSDNSVIEITDSIPLFHSQIGLLPPLEIALIMIEEYYVAQGLSIVGYFRASERFDDLELGNVAKNIRDHIYKCLPQEALLMLDNKNLGALSKGKDVSHVMQVYRILPAPALLYKGRALILHHLPWSKIPEKLAVHGCWYPPSVSEKGNGWL